MTTKPVSRAITDYWMAFYQNGHCTLCGNSGEIDTRGVKTPAGLPVGRLNYCICPNGQVLRAECVPLTLVQEG